MAERQGGFYSMVETRFGVEAKTALTRYSTLNKKYALAKTRKWYLIKCDTENVCPKFLDKDLRKKMADSPNRELLFSSHVETLLNDFKRVLLRRSIDETLSAFSEIESELDELATWIKDNLPEDISRKYLASQKAYSDKFFESKKYELNGKVDRLLKRKDKREDRIERSKWYRGHEA